MPAPACQGPPGCERGGSSCQCSKTCIESGITVTCCVKMYMYICQPLLARRCQAMEGEAPVVNALSVYITMTLYPLSPVLAFCVPFNPVVRVIVGLRKWDITFAGPHSLSPRPPCEVPKKKETHLRCPLTP